ncbi:MAG TPA: TonB-dependent receptor plug domain-containing protein, partial [Ignavibacteriaceae bacterium]|nr:TonB-dependent receptor plug domain-containing protein [Ignavibacteriaceae bacterium]
MKKLLLLCSVYSFLIFPQSEKNDIINISLDSLLSLPVQSASKFFQNISDAPASVTIITSADIEYYGHRNLSEVLQFVRSFYISNDKNYSYTGIRGFSRPSDYNNRILLLINGHRLNESIYGSAFIGSELAIDLSMIDKIEIVRGPGSVLYGTNAMFAVINIIVKKASQFDGVNAAVEYGSFQHKKVILNFGKEYNNGLELNISGNYADIKGEDIYFEEFDTESTNKGIALNQDKENYFSVFNSIKYKNFTFQGFYSGRTKYVPTAVYGTVFNGDTKTKDCLAFAQISYAINLYENTELFLRTYYDHYLYEGYYPYEDNSEVYDSFDESIGNQLGGEAQLTWSILSNDIIVIGTEYQNSIDATYAYWEDENEISGGNYPYQNFSFYFNNEYKPIDNLALITGIRGEKHSGIKLNIIPRVGIIYGLNST